MSVEAVTSSSTALTGTAAHAEGYISVCIASMGRPSLARTLHSLEEQDCPSPFRVLVIDDSLDGAAARVVSNGAPWRLAIEVHRVGSQNIATARNACLERATGTFMAFLDDDEWAHPGWLASLIGTANTWGADAVFGPVVPVYPPGTAPHIVKSELLQRDPGATGSPVTTGGTGNVLLRRATIERLGLTFDERFGRTGGEDTEFFHRLAGKGGAMTAAANAIAYEEVPPARLELRHLRRRYMRGGYTFAQVVLTNSGTPRRLTFLAVAAGKTLATAVAAVLLRPIRPDKALTFTIRTWAHIGKLLHGLGFRSPSPY